MRTLLLTAMLAMTALAAPTASADVELKIDGNRMTRLADQSALVVVMCENGGKTPAARAMTSAGKALLRPFVEPAYSRRTWLIGADATRQALFDAIGRAARDKPVVDVVLFVHGTKNKMHLADGAVTGAQFSAAIADQLGHANSKARRLRMVYTTACYSHTTLAHWSKVSWACRGMTRVNRPLDFPRFWLGWLAGEDYRSANTGGLAMNQRLHDMINRVRPRLLEIIAEYEPRLRDWQPATERGQQMRAMLLDLMRIARRGWFKEHWDIEESRPRICGGDARIDKQVPKDYAPTRGDDGELGESIPLRRKAIYY